MNIQKHCIKNVEGSGQGFEKKTSCKKTGCGMFMTYVYIYSRGGYLGQVLLGMCRWLLRTPTLLESILWPAIYGAFLVSKFKLSFQSFRPSFQSFKPSFQSFKPSFQSFKPSFQSFKRSFRTCKSSFQIYKPSFRTCKTSYRIYKSPIRSCKCSFPTSKS